MPDEWRHESADLVDYEVLESADTLAAGPGDDPLDRGIVTPQRWSAGMRFGTTAAEQQSGGSLDQRLTRENPDKTPDTSDNWSETAHWDENATDGDIARMLTEDGPAPRTGRLIRAVADEAVYRTWEIDAVARDVGADGGAASAEEAALHILGDSGTSPG